MGDTILIVEDELTLRSLCEAVLTRNGYRVMCAFNGQDAIGLLSQRPKLRVDLALLDVLLPGMSGPELAFELQRLRPGVPVLFMTPEAFTDLVDSGQMVISKPFIFEALLTKIRKILAHTDADAATNS